MKIITKVIERKSGRLKIYGIQIGKLAIKKSAQSAKKPGLLSTILLFRDSKFGDWLPIWTWLIEHPEGLFLIDTGLTKEVREDDYFKDLDFISKYYFEKQMIYEVDSKDGHFVIYPIPSSNGIKLTTRYQAFLQRFPNLVNRIPLNYLASYICITKYLLSRIRKELSQNLSVDHNSMFLQQFIRVHKSYLVAIGKITTIEDNELIIQDFRIPISRNYKEEVLKKVLQGRLWRK